MDEPENISVDYIKQMINRIKWNEDLLTQQNGEELCTRDKIIISLMIEQNATLALTCQLLMKALRLEEGPESNLIFCPKCKHEILPNPMGYCPNCKTDLIAFLKANETHLGNKVIG